MQNSHRPPQPRPLDHLVSHVRTELTHAFSSLNNGMGLRSLLHLVETQQ